MAYQALLTLDLDNTSPDQRDRFYELLSQSAWMKIDYLTTAWVKEFSANLSIDTIKSQIEAELDQIRVTIGIVNVFCAFQVGEGKVKAGKLG